jgi:purine-binding chemotaxis protein CheW
MKGDEYALPLLTVREIIEYPILTPVPGALAFLRGVINLRGSVVPVIDLAVRFGLDPEPVTRRTCVVLVEAEAAGETIVLGLVADTVQEVVDLVATDVSEVPAFGTRVSAEFLTGLGALADRFIFILELSRVLREYGRGVAAEPGARAS